MDKLEEEMRAQKKPKILRYPVEVTEELLAEITRKIVVGFRPQKVILFGSHAWGRPHRDSDVDLLVIVDTDERPARLAAAISRACRPKFLPLDIIVKIPEEVRQRLEKGDFFIRKILKEGRVLYEQR